LDVQFSRAQVSQINVGNLDLAASRRLQRTRDVQNLVVIEVQSSDRPGRLGVPRLLLETPRTKFSVEFNHAVPLRISDLIGKHGCAFLAGHGGSKAAAHRVAIVDIVSKDQRYAVISDELPPDDECLGEPVGAGLNGVPNVESDVLAGSKKPRELVSIV